MIIFMMLVNFLCLFFFFFLYYPLLVKCIWKCCCGTICLILFADPMQCIFKLQFSSSPMCQWLKGAGLFTDKKFPLFSVHKFSYKFRFLDDDGEKLFVIVHVSAKFDNGLIRRCNSDPVMGNTFFFIIFFYLTKISINYPTHFSKIPSKKIIIKTLVD